MDCTVDDTLLYLLTLLRHVARGDVPAAAMALLIEMGFQTNVDGFWQLRDAIVLKQQDYRLHFQEIYEEVGASYGFSGTRPVEERIRDSLDNAWKNRNEIPWNYFFSDKRTGKLKRPSSGVFIAHMACVLELWRRSCGEVYCYAAKR